MAGSDAGLTMTGDLSGEKEGAAYGCALELKAEEPAAGLMVSNWPYGLCGGMEAANRATGGGQDHSSGCFGAQTSVSCAL